jgi:hypothetical protein
MFDRTDTASLVPSAELIDESVSRFGSLDAIARQLGVLPDQFQAFADAAKVGRI